MEIFLPSRNGILQIVGQWKGLHTFCRAIIFCYNANLFDPGNPSYPGNPDGHFGRWAKDDGAGNQVPARNIVDCRYMIPPKG